LIFILILLINFYQWSVFKKQISNENFYPSVWNDRRFLNFYLLGAVYLEILAVNLKVGFNLLTFSILFLEVDGERSWTLSYPLSPSSYKSLYSALLKWTKGYYFEESITIILINKLIFACFVFKSISSWTLSPYVTYTRCIVIYVLKH